MLSTLWRGQQVEFRRITGVDVVSRFPEFMRLRETRLRSVGRTIDRLRDRSIQAMLTALANRGNVQILQMVVNASVAAADLYLVEQPVAMLRLRALDPTMSRFECGHLLLRAAIDTFAGEGYETLDLGRGAEAYKFLFGAHERVLLRAKRDGLTR
jgi:CelD/BcsL family acetyltransferase involved in cellulose biosynthesis